MRKAIAERQRRIGERRSFVTETVRIDFKLIETAQAAGYKVWLTFVALADPALNVLRVEARVATGGHAVPTAAIALRYRRALEEAPVAVEKVDSCWLLDNSGGGYALVARWREGRLMRVCNNVPEWAQTYFGLLR